MSNDACETPLLDLLNSVPADARLIYEHSPIESSFIPVGVLAKQAADALTAMEVQVAEQKSELSSWRKYADEVKAMLAEQAAQIEALRVEVEELAFLEEDLLYWVERAVRKGNANCDIEEAFVRYEKWLND